MTAAHAHTGPEHALRANAPLLWTLAAITPLIAAALWLRLHWAAIPATWPRHWDATGHVNGWGLRSIGGVALPLVLGLIVELTMLAVIAMQNNAPGTDLRMRRRLGAPIAALAWLLTLMFAALALSPLLRTTLTPGTIFVLIGVHTALIFAVMVWMVMRSGMMDVSTPDAATCVYDGTPDHAWHAGLVYFNRDDRAVVVPKRFGFGWTLNFARPLSWVFLGIVLGLAGLSVLMAMHTHG